MNAEDFSALSYLTLTLHPDDSCLYMVSARKSGSTFSVQTSWNEDTQFLNHGHFGLPDIETCNMIIDEYFKIYRGMENHILLSGLPLLLPLVIIII